MEPLLAAALVAVLIAAAPRLFRRARLTCAAAEFELPCLARLRPVPAPWRSGYAAACKAVYTGSIPVGALTLVRAVRGSAPRRLA